MSKSEPTIQKFMTTIPFSIQANQSIKAANHIMSQNHIRHLPVMDVRTVS